MCKIAQIFDVSAIVVLKWVSKKASLKDPAPHADSDIVMIDEMCHFVDEKKRKWVWRAIDGVLRRPLGWDFGTRGDSTAKRLIEPWIIAAVFLSLMTVLVFIG